VRHLTLRRNALWEREIQVCHRSHSRFLSYPHVPMFNSETSLWHHNPTMYQHGIACLQLEREYVAVNHNHNITDVTNTTLCRRMLCITKIENICSPISKTQRTNPNYPVNLSLLLFHCCVWWIKALEKITYKQDTSIRPAACSKLNCDCARVHALENLLNLKTLRTPIWFFVNILFHFERGLVIFFV